MFPAANIDKYFDPKTGEEINPNHCTSDHDCAEFSVPAQKHGYQVGTVCLYCGKEDMTPYEDAPDFGDLHRSGPDLRDNPHEDDILMEDLFNSMKGLHEPT